MGRGGGSISDPLYLQGNYRVSGTPGPDFNIITGKTQLDPRLVAGELTKTFLIIGQSNAANTTNAVLDPASDKVQNLNPYSGGIYRAKDPLLGCSVGSTAVSGVYGNWATWFAQKMVTDAVCARCVVIPMGVSGAFIGDWSGQLATSQFNCLPRIAVAANRAASLGLTIDAVLMMEAESDAIGGTSSANFQASFALVKSAIRAAGISTPILVGKCTGSNVSNVYTTNATIQGAIDAVIDNPNGVYAGANTDTLGFAYRHDGTHFSADLTVNGSFGGSNGASAVAALWVTAVRTALGI